MPKSAPVNTLLGVKQQQSIGNKADTAVQAVSDTASQIAMLKGMLEALCGTSGVVAWPAGAAPANGVSIAEGIRYIAESVITAGALGNDSITAAKFDETTAFPLKSADTGATAVARAGADGDTLKTLSDQLDVLQAGESGAAGIASYPIGAQAANGISIAEVVRWTQEVLDAIAAGTTKLALANDVITNAVFDETTAFPLRATDTGATAVARTGADSDTLKTLSDQLDTLQAELSGAAGLATFPAAAQAGSAVSLAEVIRWIQNVVDTMAAEISGAAGLVTYPAGLQAASGVSIAEVLRWTQEHLDTVQAEISGAAGLASFPAGLQAANGVSLAEVIRWIQEKLDTVIAGTAFVTPAADSITASVYDESTAFPLKSADTGATLVARSGADADTLKTLSDQIDAVQAATGVGTTFAVTKTVNHNTIVAAGADLTGVSTGSVLIEDVIVLNSATEMDSAADGAVLNLVTNNVVGSAAFATMAQAKGLANAVVSGPNLTSLNKVVLEAGKKVVYKSTGEVFTSDANITVILLCRRLSAGAALAAAA